MESSTYLDTLSFKLLCIAVDPPDSPDDYREVRNVSYTVKSISDAYTFTFNVTWEPPIYPHKLVESYNVIWKEKGWIFKSKKSHVRYFPLSSFTSYVTPVKETVSVSLVFNLVSIKQFWQPYGLIISWPLL